MRIKCTYDFVHFVRVALWEGDDVDLGAEAMFLVGWSASLLFCFLSLSGRREGAESTQGPREEVVVSCCLITAV